MRVGSRGEECEDPLSIGEIWSQLQVLGCKEMVVIEYKEIYLTSEWVCFYIRGVHPVHGLSPLNLRTVHPVHCPLPLNIMNSSANLHRALMAVSRWVFSSPGN